MEQFNSLWRQSVSIPHPPITAKNCPDQTGRVHIVTGGYTGVGYELARLLYENNASVYILGRSHDKGDTAVQNILKSFPNAKGKLEFIHVDLSDLKTIKPAVEAFQKKESKLHVLTNNAGVMIPPAGSKTAQGLELQIGTNCVGPYLLTKLLAPMMAETAKECPPATVRVSWAGSAAIDFGSYKPGGMCLDDEGKPLDLGAGTNYGQSKAGNLYFASESARRYTESGVVHTCFNPGNLKSELQRYVPGMVKSVMDMTILYAPVYGGYTELFCAVSPEVTMEKNGSFVMPWGRFGTYRSDIARALRPEGVGGNGKAQKFWDWCEKFTEEYN